MADREAKEEDAILIRTDQKMANQKDPLQMVTEIMPSEMIEGNKDISDADKRGTSKGTAWQKMSICIRRKQQNKMLT